MTTTTQDQQRISQLEAQVAALTALARLMLEGNLNGASGAAGALVALEGGQTTVDVALFEFGQ